MAAIVFIKKILSSHSPKSRLQSLSLIMRCICFFSFCCRDSFQLQSLPIQVFHAATSVAHWNRQNVVQLWRRQSSLHRVRLSHILHYFLNPSRWKIMEWFVRYVPHKIQRRKDDWVRFQVMENVLSDQPYQNSETSWQLLVLRTAPFISCGSPPSLFSPLYSPPLPHQVQQLVLSWEL